MDALSEVLKVVKLQGAMFYNGEFSAPWSFRSPPSCNVAPFVAAGAEHVIIYHLLTEGHASARLEGGECLDLDTGDVVIFPHGDPHIIENGRPTKTVDLLQELARIFSQGLRLSRSGGGGDVTKSRETCRSLRDLAPIIRETSMTNILRPYLRQHHTTTLLADLASQTYEYFRMHDRLRQLAKSFVMGILFTHHAPTCCALAALA